MDLVEAVETLYKMIKNISKYQLEFLETVFYEFLTVTSIGIEDEDNSLIITYITEDETQICQSVPYMPPAHEIGTMDDFYKQNI